MVNMITLNINRYHFSVDRNRMGFLVLTMKRGKHIVNVHQLGENAGIGQAVELAKYMAVQF